MYTVFFECFLNNSGLLFLFNSWDTKQLNTTKFYAVATKEKLTYFTIVFFIFLYFCVKKINLQC